MKAWARGGPNRVCSVGIATTTRPPVAWGEGAATTVRLPGNSGTRVHPTVSSRRQEGIKSRHALLFMHEGYTSNRKMEPLECRRGRMGEARVAVSVPAAIIASDAGE